MNAEELKKQKVNRQHKNKKGDRSLPKINYYVVYENLQTVNPTFTYISTQSCPE